MKKVNILPKQKSWDIIAEDYNNDITEFEKETASFLIRKFNKINLSKTKPILELGCGSGHISLLLAKSKYKVELADFSKVALDKAKNIFDRNNIETKLINADILNLKNIDSYDVIWNSGVMEHFDDIKLKEAIKSIYKKTNKYFIFFVPNPKSFFYLYYRFLMTKSGKWNVGYEFLRSNYNNIIKKSGFKILKFGYTGKTYSKNQIEYSFKNYQKICDQLLYMIKHNMFKKDQYYLKYYICTK